MNFYLTIDAFPVLYTMPKLLRNKSKGEPKKLDKTLRESRQDLKSDMQTFWSEFESDTVKKENHDH